MKLALCMISEGNHPNLKRAVKSVYKYVDGVYITTTKVKKEQWQDPKISWSYFPWNDNFADARNFNLQQIPSDYTHILWIDSDDVVMQAETIPEVLMAMDDKGLDAAFVDYNYDIDKQGNVLIVHPRERLVRKDIYKWKAALHETLIPNRKVRTVFIKDFFVNHYPTKENRDNGLLRNLTVLQRDYEQQRKLLVQGKIQEIDPRTEYYLARCLFDTRNDVALKRAFNLFQDYLGHSGWDEERAFAWNYIGNIQYHFNQHEESTVSYLSAIKERPEFPTWHLNLARSYAALKDFDKAEHHLKVGMNMEQPKTSMVLAPLEDKINALIVTFYVFFHKKDFKQSIKAAEMLYELQPTEENFKRVQSVEKLQKWTNWMKNVAEMVMELDEQGEYVKVDGLLKNLPKDVENTVMANHLRNQYAPPFKWPQKSIAYYAAIDVHEWSPKNLKTGLGGSEEAIVYLAKEWVKSGYKVTVYTNVGANEGVYDGVEYLNFQRFNAKDKFDVVVSWRNPHFIHKHLLDCRLLLLDLHDVPEVGEYDDELLNKTDYIMVKSEYHRSLLPNVPDNKFIIINNGIDFEQLQSIKAKKIPGKIGYFSSYDRGLENLLKIWPEIKKEVPYAELHIAYGWDLFLKLLSHVPHKMKWYHKMVELMKQPGIFEHGKLGKQELYELASSCSVWAYPTNFQEIDCITARYCQALGTVPVIFDYAALTTTVQRGVRLAVDPFDSKSLKKYQDALIRQLKDPKEFPELPEVASAWGWNKVSRQWLGLMEREVPQDVKVTVFTPTIRSGFWNVMAQNLSIQSHKNFEWLIVDDYPEDRKNIAEKYAQKYGITVRYLRGKLSRSKYNYSLIQADNQAIYAAQGDVILWLQDFILLPKDGLKRIAHIHKHNPNALIAPVDAYYRMKVKPNLENKEDWFDGNTSVVGDFIRQNIRIKRLALRYTNNPYDFEMNIGAIPTKIARMLNGLWEFQDDGLGFNNTDIAFRALKVGCPIIVDERLKGICLDLWEHIAGTDENAKEREWNLNDARFQFIYNLTRSGKLPVIRDSNVDRKIKLTYTMPKGLDQHGAAHWIQKNTHKLAAQWEAEWLSQSPAVQA